MTTNVTCHGSSTDVINTSCSAEAAAAIKSNIDGSFPTSTAACSPHTIRVKHALNHADRNCVLLHRTTTADNHRPIESRQPASLTGIRHKSGCMGVQQKILGGVTPSLGGLVPSFVIYKYEYTV